MTKVAVLQADAPGDVDLVEASRAGSRRAFAELVERYHALVCSVAYALTGSLSQSEEVAQETFVAAWRRLDDLRQPDRFRSWLCGIARNLSRRSQRDERGEPPALPGASVTELAVPSAEPSPLDEVIGREEEDFLWRALGAIPETYRLPLVLFYREQNSIEKVARALDISEKSVKTRLWRGRRLLQEQMAELVESTLKRSRPRATKAFAAGVLAAIATSLPGKGNAATGLPGNENADALTSMARARFWHTARAGLLGSKLVLVGAPALLVCAALVGTRAWLARSADAKSTIAGRASDEAAAGAHRGGANARPRHALPTFAVEAPRAEASAPAARAEPQPSSLLDFDFEDGAMPAGFIEGLLVPGPPRPGNRFAAVGSVALRWSTARTAVAWNPGRTNIRYSNKIVVSFDYWAPAGTGPVSVMIAAPGNFRVGRKELARNFSFHLKNPVRERWAHADVRFADFPPTVPGAPPFQDGETVLKVQFFGGEAGGGQFFVDNVKVLDYGSADPPRTDTSPLEL